MKVVIIIVAILGLAFSMVPREYYNFEHNKLPSLKTWRLKLLEEGGGLCVVERVYPYRGIPFRVYEDRPICSGGRAIYPLGLVLNMALGAGIVYPIYKLVQRRKS